MLFANLESGPSFWLEFWFSVKLRGVTCRDPDKAQCAARAKQEIKKLYFLEDTGKFRKGDVLRRNVSGYCNFESIRDIKRLP